MPPLDSFKISADHVLDLMGQHAFDLVGDFHAAEDWPGNTTPEETGIQYRVILLVTEVKG